MAASNKVVELTKVAADVLNEKLGTDIVALDMSGEMILSEVFLIATGQNEPQVEALADAVFDKLSSIGEKPIRKEGSGAWILLDYSDLVVHIQTSELRKYYMLDHLWNDCPRIELRLDMTR